jgi:methyl-accepting chemotaxis protein
MTDIVASVHKVTAIIGDISAASAEQEHGILQVNTAISDMDDVTQQNAALVEEAAAAAEAMQTQAREMAELVGSFKLDAQQGVIQPLPQRLALPAPDDNRLRRAA